MTEFTPEDAYRLRSLGVRLEPQDQKPGSDVLLRAAFSALLSVAAAERAARRCTARWRRRFWLCAAVSVAELAVIAALLSGGRV